MTFCVIPTDTGELLTFSPAPIIELISPDHNIQSLNTGDRKELSVEGISGSRFKV